MNNNKYVEFEDPFINACAPFIDWWCKWVNTQVQQPVTDVSVEPIRMVPSVGGTFEMLQMGTLTNKQD